jgi:uncharacterized membrane protein (DUF106 family)
MTQKLMDIASRKSDQSFFSSGIGAPQTNLLIDLSKMKEIRHYVSHEIYKCQKKTDDYFKDLEKIQAQRKQISQLDTNIDMLNNAKK